MHTQGSIYLENNVKEVQRRDWRKYRYHEEQSQREETKKRSDLVKIKEQAINKEIKLTKQGN